MRLANKTALITGGNSGIGLATARLFVKEGARVVITGRDQAKLDAAVKELGDRAIGVVADATDVAATEAAVAQAVAKFGKLDIVFANAGIAGPDATRRDPAGGVRAGSQHQSHRGVLYRAGRGPAPQRQRVDRPRSAR